MYLDHIKPTSVNSQIFHSLCDSETFNPAAVKNQFYQHSIYVSNQSQIVFEINDFKHFECKVGLSDHSNINCETNFSVYGDDYLLDFVPNVKKGEILTISLNLYNFKLLKLITYDNNSCAYPVWIDPIFDYDYEIKNLSACNKILNYLPTQFYSFDTCIISICDKNSIHLLQNLWNSIELNSGLTKYKFVLFYEMNEKEYFAEVKSKFNPIFLKYSKNFKNNIWLKFAIYNVAKMVNAKTYLYFDIDMLVVNSLQPLVKIIESSEKDIFLVRESEFSAPKNIKLGDLLCNENLFYFSSSDTKTLLKITDEEYQCPFIINAGFIAGNKKGFLSLNNVLKSMTFESIEWLDQKPEVDWREQGIINLAVARLKNCQELPYIFNYQLLRSDAIIIETANNLEAYCSENNTKISILHFNGDLGKKKLMNFENKFNNDLANNNKKNITGFFDESKKNSIKMYEPIDFHIEIDENKILKQKTEIRDLKNFTKIKLSDIEFIIPVRIDSETRLKNLEFTIKNLNNYFDNQIIITEFDTTSKINFDGNFKKYLFEPTDGFFDRNKIVNKILKKLNPKFVLAIECDIILNPSAILDCYKKLISNDYDFCLPFNGIPVWLNEKFTHRYYQNQNLPMLWKHYHGLEDILDESFCDFKKIDCKHLGFSYMVNYDTFKKIGSENENFITWGHEDLERVARFVKFGFEIYHSDYYCYHLWHSRAKKNSWYENLSQQKNFNEYKRICMMTTEELKQEISTWPWIKDDQ